MRKPFRNIKWKCMLYAPFLLVLTLSVTIPNVGAQMTADAISVEPSQATILAIDQTVTVNITITNITDCAGYDFLVYYNNTLLQVTEVTEQTDPTNPGTPTQMAPIIADRTLTNLTSQAAGRAGLSVIWGAVVPTYNGSGVAAQITFKGKMVGNSTLIFDTDWTKAYNYWGNDIVFDTFNDGEIEVVPEFPAAIIVPLLLIATLAATFLAKIVWSRKHRGPATT